MSNKNGSFSFEDLEYFKSLDKGHVEIDSKGAMVFISDKDKQKRSVIKSESLEITINHPSYANSFEGIIGRVARESNANAYEIGEHSAKQPLTFHGATMGIVEFTPFRVYRVSLE